MGETYSVFQWLQRVPDHDAEWRYLQIDDTEFIWHDFRGHEVWVKHRKCVSGMPRWFRVVCYVFVVVPKLLIEVAVLYCGSGYVALSPDNETVILNCVALAFIAQIDEAIYVFGVSYNVRHILDNKLTTISVSSEEWDDW